MFKFILYLNIQIVVVFICFFYTGYSVTKAPCVDVNNTAICMQWRAAGYCTSELYSVYMSLYCNETCDVCGVMKCDPNTQLECIVGYPYCISLTKFCDGHNDCQDGWDENDCDWMNDTASIDDGEFRIIMSDNKTDDPLRKGMIDGNATIKFFQRNTVTPGTSPPDRGFKCQGMYACQTTRLCIHDSFVCDGWIDDCGDGEDEKASNCYTKLNKALLKKDYKNMEPRDLYLNNLVKVKHTQCPLRHFSCIDRTYCTKHPVRNSFHCACDPDCIAREDCCFDANEVCGFEETFKIKETCVSNVFGQSTNITALLISKCPDTSTEYDSNQCTSANVNYESRIASKYLAAPVFSVMEQKHYRNYYCARCNDVEGDIIPWNVWYDCQSTENDFSGRDCEKILYVPPPSHYMVKTCTIRHFKTPRTDINTATTGEREAFHYCKQEYAPVMYNGSLYRNPYCYFIHRNQMKDLKKTRLYTCNIDNRNITCPNDTIPCRPTFTCLDKKKFCDGVRDCEDGSDEPSDCKRDACFEKFQCKRNKDLCVETTSVCDGFYNCGINDKSDEENCPGSDDLSSRYQAIKDYKENYYTVPKMPNHPSISNQYNEPPDVNLPLTEMFTNKTSQCLSPLQFDGITCKFNKTVRDDKSYIKVYHTQIFEVITWNISLKHTGFFRPSALKDNPVQYFTRHIGQFPQQIVKLELTAVTESRTVGQVSYRQLSELEQTLFTDQLNQTLRDKESYVQLKTSVYEVEMAKLPRRGDIKHQPKTQANCLYHDDGAETLMICTACPYLQYEKHEYELLENGKLKLLDKGVELEFEDYELRSNGSIIMCYNTADGTAVLRQPNNEVEPLLVWLGVSYSCSGIVNVVALVNNLYYGRKTTLRIFLMSYTSMALIWSFDAVVSAVSATFATSLEALHLYGNLGTLAWLTIISFHLMLSISEANLAAYYSVEHMLYYNLCGWICPFAWVIFFFVLSKCGITESVVAYTNPQYTLPNATSDILHFPIWVILLVILFLLVTVIGVTKKLMTGRDNKIDGDIFARRLRITMLVLVLFFISTVPWVAYLVLRYCPVKYQKEIIKIIFSLECLIQAFYLVYMIRTLARQDLERFKIPTRADSPVIAETSNAVLPVLPIPLPPKQRKHRPSPQNYVRPSPMSMENMGPPRCRTIEHVSYAGRAHHGSSGYLAPSLTYGIPPSSDYSHLHSARNSPGPSYCGSPSTSRGPPPEYNSLVSVHDRDHTHI